MAKSAAERQRAYRERARVGRFRLNIVISRLARESLDVLMAKNPQMTQQEILERLLSDAAAIPVDELIESRMLDHEYYRQLKECAPVLWVRAFHTAKSAVIRKGRSREELLEALDKHLAVMLKKQSGRLVT